METTNELPRVLPPPWTKRLAGLLPLVMMTLAFIAGPNRPLPGVLTWVLFFGAVAVAPVLIWKRWMAVELALYSLLAVFLLQIVMDEIPAPYSVPFTLIINTILLLGALGYIFSPSRWVGWIFLIAAVAIAYGLAGRTTDRFWSVFCTTTFEDCMACISNFPACKPAAQQTYPWWKFLLRW